MVKLKLHTLREYYYDFLPMISKRKCSFLIGTMERRDIKVPPLTFFRPTEELGELSNFYAPAVPLVHCDKEFSTAEHLYHWMKLVYPGASADSLALAEQVRVQSTPYKAKFLVGGTNPKWEWQRALVKVRDGFKDAWIRDDWEAVREEVMRRILFIKFRGDAACRAVLFRTEERGLVEASPYDSFWGCGRDGRGENILGKLLVEVREMLIAEEMMV